MILLVHEQRGLKGGGVGPDRRTVSKFRFKGRRTSSSRERFLSPGNGANLDVGSPFEPFRVGCLDRRNPGPLPPSQLRTSHWRYTVRDTVPVPTHPYSLSQDCLSTTNHLPSSSSYVSLLSPFFYPSRREPDLLEGQTLPSVCLLGSDLSLTTPGTPPVPVCRTPTPCPDGRRSRQVTFEP